MNLWSKRILGALPMLGCGAGITAIAMAAEKTPLTVFNSVVFILFGAYYIGGAVAGMMLLEGRRNALTANFFYWLPQTLHFYSFVLSFFLWAPFNLGGWWNFTTSTMGFTWQAGSTFYFALLNNKFGSAVEVNLLAIACCVYLYAHYRRERQEDADAEPSPPLSLQTQEA